MFNILSKLAAIIETLIAVVIPLASPTPSPLAPIASESAQVVSISPSPTPISLASPTPTHGGQELINKLTKQLEEVKVEIAKITPTPILQADFCRNIPYAQSVLPIGHYRTADGDCFLKPVETSTPVPVPVTEPIYASGDEIMIWDNIATELNQGLKSEFINVEGFSEVKLVFKGTDVNGNIASGCQYAYAHSSNQIVEHYYSTYLYFPTNPTSCSNSVVIPIKNKYLRIYGWTNFGKGGTISAKLSPIPFASN